MNSAVYFIKTFIDFQLILFYKKSKNFYQTEIHINSGRPLKDKNVLWQKIHCMVSNLMTQAEANQLLLFAQTSNNESKFSFNIQYAKNVNIAKSNFF